MIDRTTEAPSLRKTIGVLGGMGPGATVDFLRRLVCSTNADSDQEHARVLVDQNPKAPSRREFLAGGSDDPLPTLRAMTVGLEQAGAELLVMPCNSAQIFARELADTATVPFVDWISETVQHVHEIGCERIGLLATDGTLQSGMYHDAFTQVNIDVLEPSRVGRDAITKSIFGPAGVKVVGEATQEARELVLVAIQSIQGRSPDAILLACTELSVLCVDDSEVGGCVLVDSSQVVAEKTLRLAGYRVRSRPSGHRTKSIVEKEDL